MIHEALSDLGWEELGRRTEILTSLFLSYFVQLKGTWKEERTGKFFFLLYFFGPFYVPFKVWPRWGLSLDMMDRPSYPSSLYVFVFVYFVCIWCFPLCVRVTSIRISIKVRKWSKKDRKWVGRQAQRENYKAGVAPQRAGPTSRTPSNGWLLSGLLCTAAVLREGGVGATRRLLYPLAVSTERQRQSE